jgi:hypothetical protein
MDAACKSCNLDLNKDKGLRDRLKAGAQLDQIFGEKALWHLLEKRKNNWWEELELFDWSLRLVSHLKKLGDFAFLSSPGNIHKYTSSAANASYGKVIWVNRYFPDTPLILTHEKWLCANQNSLLIDDSVKKIEEFKNHGGKTYLFPNQYSIFDGDVGYKDIIRNIDDILFHGRSSL